MSTQTQCDAIRAHLHSHGTITPLEALQRYGCMRLGARIYDLKAEGLQITARIERNNGKRYARYQLHGA